MLRMLKCVPMKLQVIRSSGFLRKARMPFFITRAPTPCLTREFVKNAVSDLKQG